MQTECLYLSEGLESVKLNPSVVMEVLNHYQHRNLNHEIMVLGLLMGSYDPETQSCHIKDCIPLPHRATDEGQIMLRTGWEKQIQLHLRTFEKQELIGWYTTEIDDDNDIHTQKQFTDKSKIPQEAFVRLIVDTELRDDKLSVQAFATRSIKYPFALSSQRNKTKREDALWKLTPLPIQYVASEAERIGLDVIIHVPPDEDESEMLKNGDLPPLDTPGTLQNDMRNLEMTTMDLLSKIVDVERYVDEVNDGTRNGDKSIGWEISTALSSVPAINPQQFEDLTLDRLQDLLMIQNLTAVTKVQIDLADKINHVLANTVP